MQEIGNLTRLKNLKDLRFSDPQWGDSPLALLHNYRVCKLPLFRKISSLFLHALLAERERFRSWKPHFFHIQLLASLLGGGYTFCQWVRTSSHSWVCVQTYILFRLRQLQSLDTVDLTDECKQAAKAMYTRKRVYYNMCIKSLQQTRNSSVTSSSKADMRQIKALQK